MKTNDLIKEIGKIDDEYLMHSEEHHNYGNKSFGTTGKIFLTACASIMILICVYPLGNMIKNRVNNGDIKKSENYLGYVKNENTVIQMADVQVVYDEDGDIMLRIDGHTYSEDSGKVGFDNVISSDDIISDKNNEDNKFDGSGDSVFNEIPKAEEGNDFEGDMNSDIIPPEEDMKFEHAFNNGGEEPNLGSIIYTITEGDYKGCSVYEVLDDKGKEIISYAIEVEKNEEYLILVKVK